MSMRSRFLVVTAVAGLVTGMVAPSFAIGLANWRYRKQIAIDAGLVSATENNFPVLINLSSDTDLRDDAQSSGNDILFALSSVDWATGDNSARLDHEIELYTSASGELVAWVRIPTLSGSADTELYMYYGHSSCGSQENAEDVWDSNYRLVQHLSETSGTHDDSTTNDLDGTAYGGATQKATGKIGGAVDFDGDNDYVECPTTGLPTGNANRTMSGWAYIDQWSATESFFFGYGSFGSYDEVYEFYGRNSTDVLVFTQWGEDVVGSTLTQDNWHYVVAVNSGDNITIYLDGEQDGTGTLTLNTTTSGNDLYMGRIEGSYGDTRKLDGMVDEVRVSDIVRSADWIRTCYSNQVSPSTFYALGSEEENPTQVVLYSFEVDAVDGAAVVRWRTASESETLGFRLYRRTGGDSWAMVGDFVEAKGYANGGIGAEYSVIDPDAVPGETCTYKLVELETDGGTREHGPFERRAYALKIMAPFAVTDNGIVLRWLSRGNEFYRVLRATNLSPSAFDIRRSAIPATPPENVYTDAVKNAGAVFYRIEVDR